MFCFRVIQNQSVVTCLLKILVVCFTQLSGMLLHGTSGEVRFFSPDSCQVSLMNYLNKHLKTQGKYLYITF